VASGIHPHEAGAFTDAEVESLAAIWRQPGIVAAGEMGLDYHYDFSPRDAQQRVFRKQLDLAARTSLPVVIHSREAHGDVVRILLEQGFHARPVVFHCFTGTRDEAAEIRSHGWRVSFTGVLTFKNSVELQKVCAETPPDELMFETDSPYLSPEPVRKMRPNEPRNVVHTARFAADLRGEPFESVARSSTINAVRFFALPE
jgi:TatD DNase family protein